MTMMTMMMMMIITIIIIIIIILACKEIANSRFYTLQKILDNFLTPVFIKTKTRITLSLSFSFYEQI